MVNILKYFENGLDYIYWDGKTIFRTANKTSLFGHVIKVAINQNKMAYAFEFVERGRGQNFYLVKKR